MAAKSARKSVAIIVPPQAQSLDVSGPLDAFLEANRHSSGGPLYEVRLVATGPGRTIKVGGMSLVADISIFDEVGSIDTMLVAGTPDYAMAYASRDLHAWLRRRAPRTRRYGSVCTGAFFLGAAGLLDGMSATTHWQHAAELAERFPAAKVVPDQIYVQDGALYTSAGVTAGIDLTLKLIEDDHGRDLALTVARRLVVFLKRPGGQSQFSAHLAAQIADEERFITPALGSRSPFAGSQPGYVGRSRRHERAEFYARVSERNRYNPCGFRRDGACRCGETAARGERNPFATCRFALRL